MLRAMSHVIVMCQLATFVRELREGIRAAKLPMQCNTLASDPGHVMQAMKAYEETLQYSPDNKVAQSRVNSLRNKVSMAR